MKSGTQAPIIPDLRGLIKDKISILGVTAGTLFEPQETSWRIDRVLERFTVGFFHRYTVDFSVKNRVFPKNYHTVFARDRLRWTEGRPWK